MRDAIWEEVAAQVSHQGCLLGYHAAAPPVLTQAAAIRLRSAWEQEFPALAEISRVTATA